MKRLLGLIMIVVCGMQARALGSGLLIPKDESIPPLAIESQRVDIQIKDGTATARIEQVFRNSINRNLEAVYVFPLPENASISDFALYINGKRTSGELVEKDKARRTYEDIVRRMKDPGLLEHLGGNLFRVSVFPVPANGLQKIELEYSQTLAFDSGLYKYEYPLKTGDRSSRTLADFTVSVHLNSLLPLKNIYSPTHNVCISRKGDHEATIGFEEDKALLDHDFVLYYAVSKKEFGLNLLTHATRDDKGYFMMMLAPSVATPESVMSKDVTFVIDTSGSMAGSKLEQTKKALEYCVKVLHDGDRFNVIRFSTDVEPFRPTLQEVNAANRDAALAFMHKMEARGGTAINDALAAARAMNYDNKRPALILFLTDGRPTVGETTADNILANMKKDNNTHPRVFVFGVGEDVNAHLLDKIANQNGGLPEYVAPNEDIEIKVSGLADKMSNPVLANVRLEVDKLKTSMIHPSTLPDLFSGNQITVFGRYDGSGDFVIRLSGDVNGTRREFIYEGTFPTVQSDNTFIPRLWATRRVGFLLDEIRLHGENAELKDEVIRLSREHGIMTPYTSYLVLEDDNAYAEHRITRQPFPEGNAPTTVAAKKAEGFMGSHRAQDSAMVPNFQGEQKHAYRPSAPKERLKTAGGTIVGDSTLREESGANAIAVSQAIADYKRKATASDELATVKHVGRKVFTLLDGRWLDQSFKPDMKIHTVKFGSDEYFKILKQTPGLKDYLALGAIVTVVLDDGSALVVE